MEEKEAKEVNAKLAHITKIGDEGSEERVEQTLSEHARATAEYAGEALRGIGLYNAGYFAGLLHDMGKGTEKFQNYLERAFAGEDVARGSVNHSFAAVKFLFDRYYKNEKWNADGISEKTRILACEMIAVAMGSHHGLFDIACITMKGPENGFEHRIKYDADEICYDEAVKNFLNEVAGYEELDCIFRKACIEIEKKIETIDENAAKYKCNKKEIGKNAFTQFGYMARLLTSAIIDGDRRDTAEFMSGKKMERIQADDKFWEEKLRILEQKIANKNLESEKKSSINEVRKYISDQCADAAICKPGIYRLSVPTGSGKTLSSLRYALAHAAKYNKKRVVMIIPLLSVLEQNSKEIGNFIGDEMILEHHSNVVETVDATEEQIDMRELLVETWQAPVVISTLVQLLNIIFTHDTSAIRRMQSLCDSVIVIDEVQSLPIKFTRLFILALNFLTECCNATVVLCSATQPAFENVHPALHTAQEAKGADGAELVTLNEMQKRVFVRNRFVDMIRPEGITIAELAQMSNSLIQDMDSILVICNTRRDAQNLFLELKKLSGNEYDLYHLSTSMCPKHRSDVLSKIGKTPGLDGERKVICVSTQMCECGIDFSFESVIRVEAGVDNIVQSAGRCNRGNEWSKICDVYIVRLQGERLEHLPSIREAQNCFRAVRACVAPSVSIDSPEFVTKYYERYFHNSSVEKEMMYYVNLGKDTNEKLEMSMVDMLGRRRGRNNCKFEYQMDQPFKTAGQLCKVFDNERKDVIVDYDEVSRREILRLEESERRRDFEKMKDALKKLKPYTVSLFGYEVDKFKKQRILEQKEISGVWVLGGVAYDGEFGVFDKSQESGDNAYYF